MAEKDDTGDNLSPREERYCQEFIVDLNQAQAAVRSGFSKNARSAAVQSVRLMKKSAVKARIKELMKARSDRTEITSDTVLRELMRLATVDVTQAFDEKGWLKDMKDIPEDVRRAISGLETQELFQGEGDQRSIIGVARKLRFYDKIRPLELLGKHVKLFPDRHEHSGPDGKPIEMRSAEKLTDAELDARAKALIEKEAGK